MAADRLLPLVACVVVSAPAAADPVVSPITNRDYAIDLYEGVPLGNSATIAMGGASVANAIGTSGTLVNPSAMAVRSTTDTDWWNWDYHLDYLNGSLSSDYANSGLPNNGGDNAALTAGIGLRIRDWGAALTGSWQTAPIELMTSGGDAQTFRLRLAISTWIPQIDTAIGVSGSLAQFSVDGACGGSGCSLFTIQGGGGEAGATWIPRLQNFRVGTAVASEIVGGKVIASECSDLSACDGFILPTDVVSPWRAVAGGAYRWGETEWNQLVGGDFRDEPSLTAVADVVVTGESPNAFGLDAFGRGLLERSGRHAAWSVRGGVEYEWLPGRLRLRAGSYWEPGRFEGVDGRLHGTFGVEVRALEFHLYGRRRGRFTLTSDFASQYRNLGVSIGFWH